MTKCLDCMYFDTDCYAEVGDCIDYNKFISKESAGIDPKSSYYDAGGIVTLDIIRAKLTDEQYQGFLLGNILKYSCRANHKGQKKRDLEKVSIYASELSSLNLE